MTAIDFGAPVALEATCPGCGKRAVPLWERAGVRRCASCWARVAAPRAVSFLSGKREEATGGR